MKNKKNQLIALFILFLFTSKILYCSDNIYTYYCAIDRIIQQFNWPGIYYCPKCNAAMMPK